MSYKTNTLRDAVILALVAGLAASNTASAQVENTETTELDRVEVTGSRLKRVDIEGANPVTVISRVELERSGELSVADVLRNSVYNSYGSTVQGSGSATSSAATINLRGLGSEYTLVLIDGRRATSSPSLNGAAQNINLIPAAAVERIEILREGAGAIYGSDAIGGVVNVIMRKDYEGAQLSFGYESPEYGEPGTTAAFVAGITSDRGSLTLIADHQERDIMYNSEIRDKIPESWWNGGLSSFTSSANFYSSSTGLVSHPDATAVDPNNIDTTGTNVVRYDHGATSAYEAGLKRDSLLVNGRYNITDDLELFLRASSIETETFGVYASAPVDTYPTISADNPYNPFGVDGTLYYRFTPLGTRDTTITDTAREINFGLRGKLDIYNGADWEVGASHGRIRQLSIGENYGLGSALQDLIDSGEYNPFDPNDPSVTEAAPSVAHTVLVHSEQREVAVDGHINFYDVLTLPAGEVQLVTGFDYRDSRLSVVYDAQSAAGNVFGSAGSNTGGERAQKAFYFESLIPILSSLNLTLAGRYDDYNDFGSEFSPHVSLEFRPIDSLLLRGSWGKGFRAPTLDDLYGVTGTTNLTIPSNSSLTPAHAGGDEVAAAALAAYKAENPAGLSAEDLAAYQPYPVSPTSTSGQYQFITGSNPDLEAETSENVSLGVVWNPLNNLSLALDYYDIKIENIIGTLPRSLAVRLGESNGGVIRNDDIIAPGGYVLPGAIQSIDLRTVNGDSQEISGLDLEVNYTLETDIGRFLASLAWSHRLKEDYTATGLPVQDNLGEFGYPKDKAQMTVAWTRGDFNLSSSANYIGKSGDESDRNAYYPSWTTVDLQLQYSAPWNGKFTIGVRNIGNRFPHLAYNQGFPYYSKSLYSSYGRTPYIRYEHNF